MTSAFQEDTRPLLRPNQIQEMEEDVRRIEGELNAPAFIRDQIQDRGAKIKQLKQIKNDLETQRPRPYAIAELDGARRRHDELLDQIRAGMPTQAEMRRRPPGAVDKHMGWERRNKAAVLELKNIRLRMLQSGVLESDAGEVANIERFRPAGGAQELAMDGALIQGKDIFLPPAGAAPPVLMTEAHAAKLREIAPDLADSMAALPNDARAEIIARLDAIIATSAVAPRPKKAPPQKERKPSAYNLMQQEAKALGINAFGMSTDRLQAAIAAAKGARDEEHRGRGGLGPDQA